jgi:nucleoside-diphosphate-sugar epimerase
VLVTGAAGFIGRNLVGRLALDGVEVAAMARTKGPRLADLPRSVRVLECDLLATDQLTELMAQLRPVVVFHLAAGVAPSTAPMTIVQANVIGTANLLMSLLDGRLTQFVYVGSGFEYGAGAALGEMSPLRPMNLYGATKAAGHLLAHSYRRSHGLPVITVRPFTPFGPWEAAWRLVPFVIARALDGIDIPLTPGLQERDYVYVSDVVEALLRSVAIPATDDAAVFNVCSGRGVTVRSLVETILRLTGSPPIAKFGALPHRAAELMVQSGDASRAREVLGWAPKFSLADGLSETIAWVKANREKLVRLA